MITIIPNKTQDIDFNSIKRDHREYSDKEYMSGATFFAQELYRRMEIARESKGDNVKDNYEAKSNMVNKQNNIKLGNKENGKLGPNNSVNKRNDVNKEKIGVKFVKKEQKVNKKISEKEMKEIKNLILNRKRNEIENERLLKDQRSRKVEFSQKKVGIIKLKVRKKGKKDISNIGKKIAKLKSRSFLKQAIRINKENDEKNSKIKSDFRKIRKGHLSKGKVKLSLKNPRQIHKGDELDVNSKLIDSFGKENQNGKQAIKNFDMNIKSDMMMISKKYDFNIPEIAGKMDNLIHRTADELFGEIVKHFTFVVNRGGGEAKLSLYPPELGKIKMSIKLHNGKVSTFFLVDNQAVKEIIDARLNLLQQNLIDQGFSLGSFDVGVKDDSESLEGFKNFSKGINRKTNESIESVDGVSGEPEEAASYAVIPWLSSYINITV